MTDIVARAKAALEGVTEGPWATDGTMIACELVKESPGITSYKYGIADMSEDEYDEEDGEGTYEDGVSYRPYEAMATDAEFIAAARTLVPELIEEVEHLRALESRVRSLANYWTSNDPADPRLPQGLRQGGQTILAVLDNKDAS